MKLQSLKKSLCHKSFCQYYFNKVTIPIFSINKPDRPVRLSNAIAIICLLRSFPPLKNLLSRKNGLFAYSTNCLSSEKPAYPKFSMVFPAFAGRRAGNADAALVMRFTYIHNSKFIIQNLSVIPAEIPS